MYEIKYREKEHLKVDHDDYFLIKPNEWEVKKLKHVAKAFPSNVDKKTKKGERSVKLCNYTDVYYNDLITERESYMIATASEAQIVKFKLHPGDILLTKDSESPDDIGIPSYVRDEVKDLICAYHLTMIRVRKNRSQLYYYYLMKSNLIRDYFAVKANGVTRYGLGSTSISETPVFDFDLSEQQKIANFLDIKTAQFNSIISKKEQLIEKLKEAKKSLVFEAVTGKVKIVEGQLVERATSEMKDSGVEWLGEIPKTWNLVPMKRVFRIKKIPIYKDDNIVLSLTQRGLKIKNLDNNKGQHASSYSGYQQVLRNDFVMNHMDLLTGYVDCSTFIGVTSPDYRVFKFADKNRKSHLYYLKYFQMGYSNRIFYSYGQGVSYFGRWRLQTESFKYYPICDFAEEEQISISNYLESRINTIDAANDKIVNQIDILKQAKQSLISEAVTGKIDLRDWEIIEEGEMQ